MSKHNVSLTDIAIDKYINALKVRAIQDKIKIKTRLNLSSMMLMIHAEYDWAVIKAETDANVIVSNMSNVDKIVDSDYEFIKKSFIEMFEEDESNQEEDEVDEHWDLI